MVSIVNRPIFLTSWNSNWRNKDARDAQTRDFLVLQPIYAHLLAVSKSLDNKFIYNLTS